jgi:hypothetical protein
LLLKIPQSWNRADVPTAGNKYDSRAHGFALFNQRIFGQGEARICEEFKEWSTFTMSRDRVLEGRDFLDHRTTNTPAIRSEPGIP